MEAEPTPDQAEEALRAQAKDFVSELRHRFSLEDVDLSKKGKNEVRRELARDAREIAAGALTQVDGDKGRQEFVDEFSRHVETVAYISEVTGMRDLASYSRRERPFIYAQLFSDYITIASIFQDGSDTVPREGSVDNPFYKLSPQDVSAYWKQYSNMPPDLRRKVVIGESPATSP